MGRSESIADNIPWLVYPLVLFVLVEHSFPSDQHATANAAPSDAYFPSGDGVTLRGTGLKVHEESVHRALKEADRNMEAVNRDKDNGDSSKGEGMTHDEAARKKLNAQVKKQSDAAVKAASEAAEKALENIKFNITVPCVMGYVEPCGKLVVGSEGLDIKTPFGKKHIPGTGSLKPEVEETEKWLTKHTAIAVFLICLLFFAKTCLIKKNRDKALTSARNVFSGKHDTDDPDESETEEERAKELANKLDPGSADFVAPGNIYRLLAVLHPAKIGYSAWAKYAAKAGICCYMQLYLPTKILKHTLSEWSLLGIKSPLWFMTNAMTFASMIAALLSLCNMFAGKCGKSIMDGAQANYYIMSHKDPLGALPPQSPRTYQPVSSGPADEASNAAEAAAEQAKAEALKVANQFLDVFIMINQNFWCTLSLLVNIGMSFMLQLVMFLKVATFTGPIDGIAVVAVALYFIFELDDKVFDADPDLRKKYRRAVLKQTEETKGPKFIMTLAQMSKYFLEACVPFGLLGIVLFSWKNSENGVVIGGDGITRK